jgi:hypothetical protein
MRFTPNSQGKLPHRLASLAFQHREFDNALWRRRSNPVLYAKSLALRFQSRGKEENPLLVAHEKEGLVGAGE